MTACCTGCFFVSVYRFIDGTSKLGGHILQLCSRIFTWGIAEKATQPAVLRLAGALMREAIDGSTKSADTANYCAGDLHEQLTLRITSADLRKSVLSCATFTTFFCPLPPCPLPSALCPLPLILAQMVLSLSLSLCVPHGTGLLVKGRSVRFSITSTRLQVASCSR